MDWLQFLQIVCVPAFVWLVYKFGEMRKELNDFKVQVAREYATQVREFVWSVKDPYHKRVRRVNGFKDS